LFSIDAAIEIADAAYLFRLLRKSNHDIEMVGQMAHRGPLLMLFRQKCYPRKERNYSSRVKTN